MNALFTGHLEDREIAERFQEAEWVAALVRVEVALARAQAKAGLVPRAAAEEIARKAGAFAPDHARLRAAVARDGFPIVGLLEQLRAQVGGEAAEWIHWGATTQDIVDTVLALQVREALETIARRLMRLGRALAKLAEAERGTLMVGRTHLQPALPITFGLKAANWLAPLSRHRRRLEELRARLLVVQLGGAAGTLASMGGHGAAMTIAWAEELGLGVPVAPWHAQRDVIWELAGWLAGVAGSAAKFAQDVVLLTQAEIGEVREAGGAGGSSAMPQKANPVRSETVLLAARLVATHHAGLMGLPPAEHERGTLSGQAELVHVPALCALTGGALAAAEELAGRLVLERERMRENLRATHGVLLAEAVALGLARHLGRAQAQALVREACDAARAEGRHLLEIVRARPEAGGVVNELPKDEGDYLGSAETFIDATLAEFAAWRDLTSK